MLEKTLNLFLERHVQNHSPLLVAFSGGPDSFCLAHLLLKLRSLFSIEIELAHMDHGLREESQDEAIQLQTWARKNGVIFHLERCLEEKGSNQEAFYRKKRYAFFQSLFKKKKYQALVLAHHQNDLEETVLKRLFEGASFENLSPLQECSILQCMPIWRPLLSHEKKEILDYVNAQHLPVIFDYTNFNGSNLRSKMRLDLFPRLEQSFGKKIRSNLLYYAKFSALFKDFMDERVHFESAVKSSIFGHYLDLSKKKIHLFEMVYGLKKFLKKRGISLHRQALFQAAECLKDKKALKKMTLKDWQLYFDRGRLIILPHYLLFSSLNEVELTEGVHQWGPWRIEISKGKKPLSFKVGSWETLFEKDVVFKVHLPLGQYFLRKKDLKNDRLHYGKRLQSLFSEKKIPSCLIGLLPVVAQNQKVITEFLTGKEQLESKEEGLNISLTYKKD